jgi:hypothetical protein
MLPRTLAFPPSTSVSRTWTRKREKGMERRISLFFLLSIVGSVFAAVAYVIFPIIPGDMQSVRPQQHHRGLGALCRALLGVGIGAVQWAKALMHGHELVEERHPTRAARNLAKPRSKPFSRPTKSRASPGAHWFATPFSVPSLPRRFPLLCCSGILRRQRPD